MQETHIRRVRNTGSRRELLKIPPKVLNNEYTREEDLNMLWEHLHSRRELQGWDGKVVEEDGSTRRPPFDLDMASRR